MAMEPKNTTKAAPKKVAPKTSVKKAAPAKKAATPKAAAATANATKKDLKMAISDMTNDAKAKAGQLKGEASKYADQASVRAKELASEGKTKTAGAMGSLAKMIDEAAPQVDEKLGAQYGDFARSAAKTVSGLAASLDQQDIDQLVNSTRDYVKKSPAVAIGAAAVVGFVLARMLKSSSND